MQKNFLLLLSIFFLVSGFLFNANTNFAKAANCSQPSEGLAGIDILTFNRAIVPCGRSCDDARTTGYDETTNCTLCHILIMVKNIFDLMFAWVIIISLIMLTVGGVTYLLSTGNSGTVSMAKSIITRTLFGFAAFLLAWLLIYTVLVFLSANQALLGVNSGGNWYEFTCSTDSPFN